MLTPTNAAQSAAPARRLGLRGPAARARGVALMLVATVAAGCGSASIADLPPAATPATSPAPAAPPAGTTFAPGRAPSGLRLPAPAGNAGVMASLRDATLTARVRGRRRILDILDATSGVRRASAPAGVGPTQVGCAPEGPCFVTDTQGDALLVFRVGAGGRSVELTRRVYVAGAPYAIAVDPVRRRLWVTLTGRNEVVELGLHGRPHILQRLATVRQPNAIAVSPTTGDLLITGRTPDNDRKLLQIIANPATADRP